MRSEGNPLAANTAALFVPLAALFSLFLVMAGGGGDGRALAGGLMLGLAIAMHALVFGAAAAQRAFPPSLARILAAVGVCVAVAAPGLPGVPYVQQAGEAGLFVAAASAAAIVVQVSFGRAPALRDTPQ
ncbi:MAG: hypothetical protein R3C25_09620 [Hyphomonadaceae bacterium]